MKVEYDLWNPENVQPNASPIILLHSLVETRTTWKNIGPDLARSTGRAVYALDARNHGESGRSAEYDFEAMARDLDEFLTDRRIAQAVLVGHSVGGKVASTLALRKPEKVEMLVLEDSTPRDFKFQGGNLVHFVLQVVQELADSAAEGGTREGADDRIHEFLLQIQSLLKISPEYLSSYEIELLPVKWTGAKYEFQLDVESIADLLHSDRHHQNLSGSYGGDTLLLLGQLSQFKIHKDFTLEKFFPRAHKVGFENCGHFIHHEFPKKFVQEITSFVESGQRIHAKY